MRYDIKDLNDYEKAYIEGMAAALTFIETFIKLKEHTDVENYALIDFQKYLDRKIVRTINMMKG